MSKFSLTETETTDDQHDAECRRGAVMTTWTQDPTRFAVLDKADLEYILRGLDRIKKEYARLEKRMKCSSPLIHCDYSKEQVEGLIEMLQEAAEVRLTKLRRDL
jgi:hypothetical protein